MPLNGGLFLLRHTSKVRIDPERLITLKRNLYAVYDEIRRTIGIWHPLKPQNPLCITQRCRNFLSHDKRGISLGNLNGGTSDIEKPCLRCGGELIGLRLPYAQLTGSRGLPGNPGIDTGRAHIDGCPWHVLISRRKLQHHRAIRKCLHSPPRDGPKVGVVFNRGSNAIRELCWREIGRNVRYRYGLARCKGH